VASIGDIAFLERKIFRVDIFLIPFVYLGKIRILYITCMKLESAF
jgi:hypothetical protein